MSTPGRKCVCPEVAHEISSAAYAVCGAAANRAETPSAATAGRVLAGVDMQLFLSRAGRDGGGRCTGRRRASVERFSITGRYESQRKGRQKRPPVAIKRSGDG